MELRHFGSMLQIAGVLEIKYSMKEIFYARADWEPETDFFFV